MNKVEIKNLKKNFGEKHVLKNISLDIKGSFGLLGPNGAGKTTLMRTLATLIPVEQGEIKYEKVKWDEQEKVRSLIGYLPQHFSAYRNLKVWEVLRHFAILKGILDKNIRNIELETILNQVNLWDQRNQKIKKLSGGMIRRVGIAQALLGNPKFLIIDEPTAGLDVEERARFRHLLRKISKDRIILISTHIVEDLETTCDQLAVLKEGNVLFEGTKKSFSDSIEGFVWELELEDLNSYQADEDFIISTKEYGDIYIMRFFSNNPPVNAVNVKPNIEDAYLFRMRNLKW
jgi:ABC-2 type transport system ATP-binding protein